MSDFQHEVDYNPFGLFILVLKIYSINYPKGRYEQTIKLCLAEVYEIL